MRHPAEARMALACFALGGLVWLLRIAWELLR